MKTNVVMESTKDRQLFGVVIRQDTNGEMLSLTDLQEAYAYARVPNKWAKKDVFHILGYEENVERIYYILLKQGFISDKTTLTSFYGSVKEKGITKVLKELKAYKTSGRGENKRTSCNPYIWMLVALELNPMLYAEVITWVTDKLILNRIEAGNFYKELSSALYKLKAPNGNINFSMLGEMLNRKVFGKHEPGLRNHGSKEELERLYILEANIAYEINKGYLKTQDEVFQAIKDYKFFEEV